MTGLLLFVLTFIHLAHSNGEENPEPEDAFFEGDMKLNRDQEEALKAAVIGEGHPRLEQVIQDSEPQRNAIIDRKYRWPEGVVKYQIASNIPAKEKNLIKNTLRDLQTSLNSCIKFEESTSGNRIYVMSNLTGCWSSVGYQEVKIQYLNLASPSCMNVGTIVHEFLHSVGLWHTQSRSDRDEHVEIIWKNIPENKRHNFKKYDNTIINHYGLPYDFDSVMHYEGTAFSEENRLTIKTKDPSKQNIIGQRKGASEGDLRIVKKMYSCGPEEPLGKGDFCGNFDPLNDWGLFVKTGKEGQEVRFGQWTVSEDYMKENCQKYCPSLPYTCQEEGVNYSQRKNNRIIYEVDCWGACMQHCQKDPACNAWVFINENGGAYAKRCGLMDGFGEKLKDPNSVAGPRNCP